MIKLIEFLMSWCEKRGKVLNITGTAGPDDVYLIRYILARNKWFSIYIHQFLRSDRDDLHDHPWHFFSYLVRGSYKELRWNPKTKEIDVTYRQNYKNYRLPNGHIYNAIDKIFVFRKATDQHQVIIDEDFKVSEKDRAPLTLFFGGPVIREWGFIKEVELPKENGSFMNDDGSWTQRSRNWIPWREYLGLSKDHPSR